MEQDLTELKKTRQNWKRLNRQLKWPSWGLLRTILPLWFNLLTKIRMRTTKTLLRASQHITLVTPTGNSASFPSASVTHAVKAHFHCCTLFCFMPWADWSIAPSVTKIDIICLSHIGRKVWSKEEKNVCSYPFFIFKNIWNDHFYILWTSRKGPCCIGPVWEENASPCRQS